MRWGVVTFPGSNDDHDTVHAIAAVLGEPVVPLWHRDRDLQDVDVVVLPGGFSYGDYLRPGAMARFSPIIESVATFAARGGFVWGICNGFQVLCEAGLLPGALIRNRNLRFICRKARIRVEETDTAFTLRYARGAVLTVPVKHGDGCYVADPATLERLEHNRQIVFRYVDDGGGATDRGNPNGSIANIAGIVNAERNVLGMMPHPEHAVERLLGGGDDALEMFKSVSQAIRKGLPHRQTVAISER